VTLDTVIKNLVLIECCTSLHYNSITNNNLALKLFVNVLVTLLR